MEASTQIPIYKFILPIKGTEAILNACGDFHYGARGVIGDNIKKSLNDIAKENEGNIFRIFTGDMVENATKTSVGHNYDVVIPDPAIQKTDIIDILTDTNKLLYGPTKWKKLASTKIVPGKSYTDIRSIGVEGNHEYRTRKLSGQWLSKDIYDPAKIVHAGMGAIIELTIQNKKLKLSKTYKIFIAHRPSKGSATSIESILRSFRKKQSVYPGIDIFVFGHFHRRFIQSDGYFDIKEERFKKVMYMINPSPMKDAEYADEAGYPPLAIGHYVNCFLPLDKNLQPYGIV